MKPSPMSMPSTVTHVPAPCQMPDVEGGILPPGKGECNIKGRQNYQPPDWTNMVLSAGLEARLYVRQGCLTLPSFGIRAKRFQAACGFTRQPRSRLFVFLPVTL
jgi:hypothetical protein